MKTRSYGVIVGRFQVPDLHDGHMELFRQVAARHDGVIVFVGVHPAGLTKDHPLTFEVRKRMIEAKFPGFIVREIRDVKTDEQWSRNLDAAISGAIDGPAEFTLYGGRDSFVPHYTTGKYKPVELTLSVESHRVSGTQLREKFAVTTIESSDFRAGMMHALSQLWPVLLATVDIAIFTTDYKKVLLGHKNSDEPGKWRFIGGHAEKGRPSYEWDARKETFEETNLDPHKMEYIGSAIIPDWRYSTPDRGVKTAFFATTVMSQGAKASDDVDDVRWFDSDKLASADIVDTHQVLYDHYRRFLDEKLHAKEAQNATAATNL